MTPKKLKNKNTTVINQISINDNMLVIESLHI